MRTSGASGQGPLGVPVPARATDSRPGAGFDVGLDVFRRTSPEPGFLGGTRLGKTLWHLLQPWYPLGWAGGPINDFSKDARHLKWRWRLRAYSVVASTIRSKPLTATTTPACIQRCPAPSSYALARSLPRKLQAG